MRHLEAKKRVANIFSNLKKDFNFAFSIQPNYQSCVATDQRQFRFDKHRKYYLQSIFPPQVGCQNLGHSNERYHPKGKRHGSRKLQNHEGKLPNHSTKDSQRNSFNQSLQSKNCALGQNNTNTRKRALRKKKM